MIKQQNVFNARILVVDDIMANVLLLEQILYETGYQHITSTIDPRRVVELHRANCYDLILLDLQMPGMDGFQVMAELELFQANNLPLIMVISAQLENKPKAIAAGATGFIGKPFNVSEVESSIQSILKENFRVKLKQ